MKPTGMIKERARAAIGSGNWTKAVMGFFAIMLIPSIMLIVSSIPDCLVSNQGKEQSTITAVIIFAAEICAVCFFVLLSPLYFGYKKMMYGIAVDGKGESKDLVYFFSSGALYRSAVYYCVVLLTRYVEWFVLCALPTAAAGALWAAVAAFGKDINTVIPFLQTVTITAAIFGSFLYFFATRRYYAATYLFAVSDTINSPIVYIKQSKKIMHGNKSKAVMLTLSFVPWFMLCFFAVPWVYVFPYYQTAMALNVHYLVQAFAPVQTDEDAEEQPVLNESHGYSQSEYEDQSGVNNNSTAT